MSSLPTRRCARGPGAALLLAALLSAGAFGCASGRGPAGSDAGAEAHRGEASLSEYADRNADFYYLVGRELELDGRDEEAIVAFRSALERDPDSALIHHKLAELLARRGRIAEAQAEAELAFSLAPSESRYRLFLGRLYRLQPEVPVEESERVLLDEDGRPFDAEAAILLFGLYSERGREAEALDLAEWLVLEYPDNLRGYFALSRALQQFERHEEAEAALQRAFKVAPASLPVYSLLARARRDLGDRAGEVEILREALVAHPDHHRLMVDLVEALVALEQSDEARVVLLRIETHYPRDLRSVAQLGYLEYGAGNFDAAAERFERVLATDRSQHEISYVLGLTRRRQGDLEGSLGAMSRIPSEHERYPDARAQMATVYEAMGDYERALREADAARRADPSRRLVFFYASLSARSGDLDGAVGQLEALLIETPGDEEVLYNLGVVHGDARRSDEAIAYMQQVLERNPNHAGALNFVGYTWAERGEQLDEAEEMIVRALEQRPEDGYIIDSLGWVYYMRARPHVEAGDLEQGRALLEQAIANLNRAVELTGGDPVISEHLGDVYLLLREPEQALRFYEEAARMGPRDAEQPELHKKLEQLRKELEAP